jgi:tetratricopeptide (TPR) repeat protein
MRYLAIALAGAIVAVAAPTLARQPTQAQLAADPQDEALTRAQQFIRQGEPADALPLLDGVIAQQALSHSKDKRRIYCARSPAETLLYLTDAAQAKEEAVVLGPIWCDALYLKAFALVDLGRRDEAQPLLEEAIRLSPHNALYLGELGEYYKSRKQWDAAMSAFSRAADASEFSPDNVKDQERGRAWRGMGYVSIELGKFDEAEALFRKCLTLNPNDAMATNELNYIAQQRAKAKAAPVI